MWDLDNICGVYMGLTKEEQERFDHCAAMIAICHASGLHGAEAEYRKQMDRLKEDIYGLDQGAVYRVLPEGGS